MLLVAANSPINKMNIGGQPNVQTSMAPNQGGIQTSIAQVPQTSQAVTSSSQVNYFFNMKVISCNISFLFVL